MTPEKFQFKTNINCSGCVASVKPHLENATGICAWSVDTADPDKVLTVETEGISPQEIIEIVKKSGFSIEPLKK